MLAKDFQKKTNYPSSRVTGNQLRCNFGCNQLSFEHLRCNHLGCNLLKRTS